MLFIAAAAVCVWTQGSIYAADPKYYLPIHGSIYSNQPTLSKAVQPLGLGRAFSKDYSIEVRILHVQEQVVHVLETPTTPPPSPEPKAPKTPEPKKFPDAVDQNPWCNTPKRESQEPLYPLPVTPIRVPQPTPIHLPESAPSPILSKEKTIRWGGVSVLTRCNLVDLTSNIYIDWSLQGDFLLSSKMSAKALLGLGIHARLRVHPRVTINVSGITPLTGWRTRTSIDSPLDQTNIKWFNVGLNFYGPKFL